MGAEPGRRRKSFAVAAMIGSGIVNLVNIPLSILEAPDHLETWRGIMLRIGTARLEIDPFSARLFLADFLLLAGLFLFAPSLYSFMEQSQQKRRKRRQMLISARRWFPWLSDKDYETLEFFADGKPQPFPVSLEGEVLGHFLGAEDDGRLHPKGMTIYMVRIHPPISRAVRRMIVSRKGSTPPEDPQSTTAPASPPPSSPESSE